MSQLETADVALLSMIADVLMLTDDEQDMLDTPKDENILSFRSILYPEEV